MTIIINTSEKSIEIQGSYSIDEVVNKLTELRNSNIIDWTYIFKQNTVYYPITYPITYPTTYPTWTQYPTVTYGTYR
jgi:hypothetical protein